MKRKFRLEIIIGALLLVVISFLTVGFAQYSRLLTLGGNVSFKHNGTIRISSFTTTDVSNVVDENHNINGLDVDFDVEFRNDGSDADYHITYEITITNDSFYSYDLNNSTVESDVTAYGGDVMVNYLVTGVNPGETIPAKSAKTFYITISVTITPGYEGDININGGVENEAEQEFIGSLLATISGSNSGDLVNNSQAAFTVSVANTYTYNRTFNFHINNDTDFSVIDCNTGNALADITIAANTTSNYQVCIKTNNGATFASSPQQVGLFMNCQETGTSSVGGLSLAVPVTVVVEDDDPPIISQVSITKTYGVKGSATLTWKGTDDHNITKYYIIVNKAGADPDTIGPLLPQTNNSYTFTNIAENTNYSFIIYGVDEFTNSGEDYLSELQTTSGPAVTTGTVNYSWTYSVSFSLSGMSEARNTVYTANEGAIYQATITPDAFRSLPSDLTVTMVGKSGNLSKCNSDGNDCNGYTFDDSSGIVKVYNVSGNVSIGGTAGTCLVKGTKVLLANGKYKSIEDVSYDDLLAVWDYKNGKLTYEYPIWIEKEHKTNIYQKTTFSDKTVLKTVGGHAVYDLDKNIFVDVNNKEEFDIGSRIAKIKDGKIIPVTVEKIEMIYKNTTYYHVVSTTYYNIIANDFLTTDDNTILSNLYGFNDNIKWPKEREYIINNSNNLYKYDDLNGSLPYYMFVGLRAKEAKYLVNIGYLTDEELQAYFIANQNNPSIVKEPITKKGIRYWPVSINNKDYGLIKEGKTFTLPKSNTKCYYNTSDDKCYKPNDKVKIYYGTHFIKK